MQKYFNIDSKLIEKIQLSEFVFELKYTITKDFEYLPGQFVVLKVIPPHRRSYSIVEVEGELITILVDIRPGGPGSIYFEDTKVGDETVIMGPYGLFSVKDTPDKKVFICTGTGIAPFVPMVKDSLSKQNLDIDFFFGTRFLRNDLGQRYFAEQFENPRFKYIKCITQPEIESTGLHKGRVTEVLLQYEYDFENTEFYICGGPEMVDDTRELLKTLGADKIFFEKY